MATVPHTARPGGGPKGVQRSYVHGRSRYEAAQAPWPCPGDDGRGSRSRHCPRGRRDRRVTGSARRRRHTSTQAEGALASLEALAPSSPTTLTEAGSSLFYPLWSEWAAATSAPPPAPVDPRQGGLRSRAVRGRERHDQHRRVGRIPAGSRRLTGPPAVLNIPVVVSARRSSTTSPPSPPGRTSDVVGRILPASTTGRSSGGTASPSPS